MSTQLTVERLGVGVRRYTVRPRARSGCAMATLSVAVTVGVAAAASLTLAVLLALVLVLWWSYTVEEESLLVMGGMGLQMCTRYATGHERIEFLETAAIADVRRDEGFRNLVRSYHISRA